MKKVFVFVGNFGSGKTELALNTAFRAAQKGRTELIDLDMVNTYFRLSERKELIESKGIRLISPNYVCTNVETLSLPAEVSSAFDQDWDTVVFDVGGDPVGATALGRFHDDFMKLPEGSLQVLLVVNVRRPLSSTPERIMKLIDETVRNARLNITGLINNTNLAGETGADELQDGYTVLREVSDRTGIPVVCTSGLRLPLEAFMETSPEARYVGETLAIDTFLHRDWNSFIHHGL
ncbi:MAG: hypothetical protein Q4A39_01050 [Eubacteriales bacterium]|nr:hypothetical protein [Eubacteriales bacterium]